MFVDKLKETSTYGSQFNVSVTENGAFGHRTSGKELLDMNFSVSSMRGMDDEEVVSRIVRAFPENELLTVKWFFFARDVRDGLGERWLFRVFIRWLAGRRPEAARAILPLIPKYGRYDDWLCLLGTGLEGDVIRLIGEQLDKDWLHMLSGKPISLLAKWLPSCNASSQATREMGRAIAGGLHITERQYRKILSRLREHLKVVEVFMSGNRWGEIDYASVPSMANLKYSNAFMRHDDERRGKYLENLKEGKAKINAGVLYPHDIVHKYRMAGVGGTDDALEALWSALPDYVRGNGSTICVADGSGSMTAPIGRTGVAALDVADAMAIYFSERCAGEFKDKYITFSSYPELVDLSSAHSLYEKVEIAAAHDEIANTDIAAVFDLILETAATNNMPQGEMPGCVLVLSDMEFDECVFAGAGSYNSDPLACPTKALFEEIGRKYGAKGYKLPRLVFWNINGRTNTIPMIENDLGVVLVGGFSPTIAQMVLSGETDPWECLLGTLNSPRYQAVEDAVAGLL